MNEIYFRPLVDFLINTTIQLENIGKNKNWIFFLVNLMYVQFRHNFKQIYRIAPFYRRFCCFFPETRSAPHTISKCTASQYFPFFFCLKNEMRTVGTIFVEFSMILHIFKEILTVNIYGAVCVKIRKIMLISAKKQVLAPTVRLAVFRFLWKKRQISAKNFLSHIRWTCCI